MNNEHSIIIPLNSIPVIPTEDGEGPGYKKDAQYFEQQLSQEHMPDFYKNLPYKVKISTLYVDTVAPLADGSMTGNEPLEPEVHEDEHPEVFIPETGIVELVGGESPTASKEQTQLVDHAKTEVTWNPEAKRFEGKIFLKKDQQPITFEWSGGLKEIPVPDEEGKTEYYSIFGIAPGVAHDVINRSAFLRNTITTIEFLPKET